MRGIPEALEVDDGFAARDPVLAQLEVAAVAGLPVPQASSFPTPA